MTVDKNIKNLPRIKHKRYDIQYLRAIAIAAVLGFHTRPEIVPQGYLGVDVFFVLSGYLMTSILNFSSKKLLSTWTVLNFYERRLKRLLPAYFLTVFTTILICQFYLINLDYKFLKNDAIWATFFGTNFQSIFKKKNYFEEVSNFNFLIHTWSLSVEVQYYLLAPFLIYFVYKTKNAILWSIILAGISLIFQILFFFNQTIFFSFVFSRIWQFFIGTIVFYMEKKKKSVEFCTEDKVNLLESENNSEVRLPMPKLKKTSKLHDVLAVSVYFSVVLVVFVPIKSENPVFLISIRFLATVLTGLAMFVGWEHETNHLSRILVYFGDISYSVYLVHWPVIILLKYLLIIDYFAIWQLLAIIFLISIVQYELFEKKLLQAKSWIVFSVCGVLFVGIMAFIILPQGFGMFTKTPKHPAIAMNEQIAENCKDNDKVVQCNWDPEMLQIAKKPTRSAAYFCSYEGPGEVTALFTGNSYALRQIVGIKEALKNRYKKIYFAARPACLAFEDFNDKLGSEWQCNEVYNKTAEFVAKLKPDFLIITQMIWGNTRFASPVTLEQARSDNTTKLVADYLKMWSAYVKNIFIIEPHPKVDYHPAPKLAQLLSQGKSTDGVFYKYESWKNQIDPAWNRLLAAMETCPKCVPVQIRDFFCKGDVCDLQEQKTKLSLYCDAGHFSPHGVERIVPTLQEKFNNAIKNFGQ